MKNTSKNAESDKKASPQKIERLIARSQEMFNSVQKAKKALAAAEDRLVKADYNLRTAMGSSRESANKAIIKEINEIARREDIMVFIWHRSLMGPGIVVTTARHERPGFYIVYRKQIYDFIKNEREIAFCDLPGRESTAFDVIHAVRKVVALKDCPEAGD